MNCNFTKFKKAALINAAFLFLAAPSFAKPVDSIDNIRNKTGELLALKQKDKAIQLILNYLKTERSRAYRSEASELLFDLGQSFMAREAQQEYEADYCVEMADEATPENWQLVKLRIWARQWRAAKLAPRRYGDKPVAETPPGNPAADAKVIYADQPLPPLVPFFRKQA